MYSLSRLICSQGLVMGLVMRRLLDHPGPGRESACTMMYSRLCHLELARPNQHMPMRVMHPDVTSAVCMCTCMRLHTCTCTCNCTYTCNCIHTCICVCLCGMSMCAHHLTSAPLLGSTYAVILTMPLLTSYTTSVRVTPVMLYSSSGFSWATRPPKSTVIVGLVSAVTSCGAVIATCTPQQGLC